MSPTGRPILNVALDEETLDRFHAFCVAEGVTSSALVEAFARLITSENPPEALRVLVGSARVISAERRSRK